MTVTSHNFGLSSLATINSDPGKTGGIFSISASAPAAFCWPTIRQTICEHRDSQAERGLAISGGLLWNL